MKTWRLDKLSSQLLVVFIIDDYRTYMQVMCTILVIQQYLCGVNVDIQISYTDSTRTYVKKM